jgi:hypothetical protein
MSIRLVQLQNATERRVAFVEEPRLVLLENFASVYELARAALQRHSTLADLVEDTLSDTELPYDPIYAGKSEWHILPPLDHPTEPARVLVSGTGLTHLGSARERNAMHGKTAQVAEETLTDSMKMFRWGVENGKPAEGELGISPEWFYKGTGAILRAHNQPLDKPPFAEDGGEEAELAGLYLIDDHGTPVRVGIAQGNEFSDHRFEKRNYLNLAGSKLRTASVGPELVIAAPFASIPGTVTLRRNDAVVWQKSIRTGEDEMCHSLRNIEHHHFKFPAHRRPGDVHIHFFGADALSFGDDVQLQDGDLMEVHFEGFGRPLRNPLNAPAADHALTTVKALV